MVTRTLSSSSTSRMLPLAIGGRTSDRERDGEGRAAPEAAAHLDRPAMALDDPERHPQAQAGALALALGRKERLEQVRHVLLGDARAGVADLDQHRVAADQFGLTIRRQAGGDV